MPDFRITPKERLLVQKADSNPQKRREFLVKFWYSRLSKKDPVARIGFPLWCVNRKRVRHVIKTGDRGYWNDQGYWYWHRMAALTFANVADGLEASGFEGGQQAKYARIEEIGVKIAQHHKEMVKLDYRKKLGNVPGLLSAQQMAKYHKKVFRDEGIPPHYYGGTRLSFVPDEWELELYGNLYCHDCDARP